MYRHIKPVGMFLLLLMLILGTVSVYAQEATVCDVLSDEVLDTVSATCGELNVDELCIGAIPATVAGQGGVIMPGENVSLDGVTTIITGAMNPDEGTWGIVMLNVKAGLQDSSLRMILFGDSEITNVVEPANGDSPTMTVKNTAGYAINLRGGPGTTFATAGTMNKSDQFVTDGRSANGEWFHVQTEDGEAWVHFSLVSVDGDTSTLAVLDNPYIDPLQAMKLTTNSDAICGVVASGLLIQHTGDEEAKIQINGVDLVFSAATLLVQVTPDDIQQVQVIDGEVRVLANQSTFIGEAGQSMQVALGGGNTPQVKARYSFTSIGGAPLALLSQDDNAICVIGVGSGDDVEAVTYGGPGDGYSKLASLDVDAHYAATGYALDADEQAWWKLDTDRWVLQSDVRTAGLCGSVEAVEPPQIATSPASGNTIPSGTSLVPAGQSVWQADSGQDVLTGTCSTPPIAICSHPAAIIANPDGTISWRGQEPTPYTMTPTGTNTYHYTGRNFVNNGNIILDLTMTSESTWSMTFSTILDSDPTCTHTFYYTGTRKW
jgi:hypothetical protein